MTRILRWVAIIAYGIPVLIAALFTLVNVIEADRAKSDAAWLFVTAASFSLATAGGVLLVWAFLIRKAPRPLWVKGTEVLREVAVLCAGVFGAMVLYSSSPDFHDRANEILMPALGFFVLLLWAQTVGPGWAHFVEVREKLNVAPEFPGREAHQGEPGGHDNELTLATVWCFALAVMVAIIFSGIDGPVPDIAYVYLALLVALTWLLARAHRVSSTTGATWAMATQALRQVVVASLVVFVFNIAVNMAPPAQEGSGKEFLNAVTSLVTAGIWILVFGSAKTVHVEAAAAMPGQQATTP